MIKKYRLYGKDKNEKRWHYIATRNGQTKASVLRTFKKRSGWSMVMAKEM